MIIHGKDFNVSLMPRGTIACAKSCELDIDVDAKEVTSPDSGEWRDFITGRKGWKIGTNHLVSNENFDLFKTLIGQKVAIQFTSQKHGMNFYGYAICQKVVITANNGSLAQGSFSFLGCGELK